MRKVFPRENVAHLWAHGVQDEARDSSQNFFFTGATLYSYGSHYVIAHLPRGNEYGALNGRVLWNDESRSNTTSKHSSIAWRALTRQQRETCLHVPALNQDQSREIARALEARKLPAYTDALLCRIRSDVASITGRVHGSGPMRQALYSARKYETTAVAFYAHAGRKYPLPALPTSCDDIPREKSVRAAWVLQFARPIVESEYRQALKNAGGYLKLTENGRGDAYGAEQALNNAARAIGQVKVAGRAYETLHPGKKSASIAKLWKIATPTHEACKAAVSEHHEGEARARCEHFARTVFKWARDKTKRQPTPPGWFQVKKGVAEYPELFPADSVVGLALARAQRWERADMSRRFAGEFARAVASGDDFLKGGFPADARQQYSNAIKGAGSLRAAQGAYDTFLLAKIAPDLQRITAALETLDAEIARVNAARIEAWVSGASDALPPYGAGTFARIKGNIVQTTRHASVPIEHACRLARVFDRVVSAGGRSWTDGAGPMVGHYRVNHIGADGSLTIGCHEFTSTEARRLRDILAQCPECAGVTETEGA